MAKLKVFVIDVEEKALLPTSPARARILLRKSRAKVYSVEPFTIKLNKAVNFPSGDFTTGIDDGSKFVGIAIGGRGKVVFMCNLNLRQDVSKKMLSRSQYRRTRRSRKVRHRKPRFLNRGIKGWISPTIKQKKDSILRVIVEMQKRLNITSCVVEQGQFDISSIVAGRKLCGKEYQKSEMEGNNWRHKILWRDGYKCQKCGNTDHLEAHHIIFKSNEGTNALNNGITLCKECHKKVHLGTLSIAKRPKHFKYPAHLQQGKNYLRNGLLEIIPDVDVIFGWMTSKLRRFYGLPKDHYFDAASMIGMAEFDCEPYLILPKRTKIWEDNPTKKCTEKNGFRHYDIVKAKHRTRGTVIGSVRSLKKSAITLRTKFDKNFPVSYNKSKLIYRPKNLIFIRN